MKLPHLQFYVGDWRKAIDVQSHSYHDRGVWFELLCFMHESEQRGKLITNGKAIPDEAICRMLGLDKQVGLKTIQALLDSGVADRDPETGALMSRRMVRDEQLRKIRAEAGKKGGNPLLLKQNPTTPVNQIPDIDNDTGNSASEEKGTGEKPPDPPPKPDRKIEIATKARVAVQWLNAQAGRRYLELGSSLKPIMARLEECEGDIEGVKKMISRQVALWKDDPRTAEWLCPATLFRVAKFHEYYANRDLPVVRSEVNSQQQIKLTPLPWKRIEEIKEKIQNLAGEFTANRDEARRAAIRVEIDMLKAEKKSLESVETGK